MQRLYLLIAALLLSVTWVAAQSDQSTSGQSSSSSANETSIQGCVTGTVDQLILIDAGGNSYQLSGDSNLGKHVGHEVRATGTQSSAAGAGGAAGTPSGTAPSGAPSTAPGAAPSGTTPSATTPSGAGGGQPIFKVTKVTMISDTCKQPKQ
jgi:hypothetical protein